MLSETPAARAGANRLLPGAALLLLAGCTAAYLAAPQLYFSILSRFTFGVAPRPFLDIESVARTLSCWHEGVDIFTYNPCDSLGQAGIYSPLWLWIPPVPTGQFWTNLYGLASALAFVAALAGLPRARSRAGALIMLVALASPPVFFAVERANVDLLMFALSMLAIVLMDRTFVFRLAGYGAAEAAAFLKYYPLALIALAAREQSRRAIIIGLVSVVAFAAYIWIDLGVFEKFIRLTPVLTSKTEFGLGPGSGYGRWYGDLGFGADLLAQVVANIVDRTVGARLPPVAIKLPLIVAAGLVAFVIARRPAMSSALWSLSARELHCLIGGI